MAQSGVERNKGCLPANWLLTVRSDGRFEARGRRSPAAFNIFSQKKTGAGEGIRTLDPDLGKVVLYP
jgi:hypothetical protein